MEVSVMQILAARDQRAATQKRLLKAFGKPLICFTMNIAGPVKYSEAIQAGYGLGKRLLQARFPSPLHFEESISATGCEGFFVVDTPAKEAKHICVMIEDSLPVCRLFDMDVLDADGRKLSREELGLSGRTCLLCNNPAPVCASTRAHTVAQLQAKTGQLLETANQAAFIASLAYQALIQEVRTTPKPGLVDEHNTGSHTDMDLPLFLKSAAALQPYFYEAACIGAKGFSPADTFAQLRQAGIRAEADMYAATGGINTHKGAIFTMGLLCAAAAKHSDSTYILLECRSMARGLVEKDFAGVTMENAQTAGQRLFAKYGITGIRGQAEKGFPAVASTGLPLLRACLRKGLSLNDAGCVALLYIIGAAEDTNLIARSDPDTARGVTRQILNILGDTPTPSLTVIEQLDREFIEKNLSPGGSADLLAATYFLHFLG